MLPLNWFDLPSFNFNVFFGVGCDAFTMFCSSAFALASLIAARLPTPL